MEIELTDEARLRKAFADAALLWQRGKLEGVVTGFGLSDDGLWRRHSWGVTKNTIIETTVLWRKYYGWLMAGELADAFVQMFG